MLSAQAVTLRLEAYLVQLGEVHRLWQSWLSNTQKAATAIDTDQLVALQSVAGELGKELENIRDSRQRMLTEARQSGWPAKSLLSLAEKLPAWNRPSFRAAFSTARNRLEQIRRLHVATWVMLNQSAQHYQEMTMLLTLGTTHRDVYETDGSRLRDGGGQLLDASL